MTRGLAVAAFFLTRLPLPVRVEGDEEVSRSVPWFPWVGAMIGLAIGAVLAALASFLPDLVAAALALGFGLLLTGALHEDGLADTFDGLGGGADRERVLEIMRDSRIGTFGAAALVVSLLVRVAALAALVAREPVVTLAVVHGLSRAAAISLMAVLPPAANEGLGRSHAAGLRRRTVWASVALAAVAAAAVPGSPLRAVAVLLAATLPVVVLAWWAARRIGGVTGDVLGAAQQVSEVALLVTFCAG